MHHITNLVDYHATIYCHYSDQLANLKSFDFPKRKFLKEQQQYHQDRWLHLTGHTGLPFSLTSTKNQHQ